MNWHYIADTGPVRFFLRTAVRQFVKRVLGRGLNIHLPTGLTIYLPPDSAFGSEAFVTGADVDWGSEALFTRHLDNDGDVIDAGANIGYYSAYVAPCVHHVWAFEPDPRVLTALRKNASRGANITVVDKALFSKSGTMHLDVGARPEVNSLVAANPTGTATIEVAVETIDNFTSSHPDIRITGIKIDVEGRDMDVLAGASETIVRDQPLVLTEFNIDERGVNDEAELIRFAAGIGYGMFGFIRSPGIRVPRYHMRRLGDVGFALGECKMIFLVPHRLKQAFESEIL